MLRIRVVESEIARRYAEQEMRCPVHLSIGQEAPAAAFGLVADRQDQAVSSHRGHAHYLAKGGDLDAMIAELHGRASGCSGGIGGSMHLVDVEAGFMGTSAIVGNSIPVGVGLALGARHRRAGAVVGVFFGDGATEEGVFYESINIAALLHLPVLFLCENNRYSVYTDIQSRWPPGRDVPAVVQAMGIRSSVVDGQDAVECLATVEAEMARIRSGDGPALIEFQTYRYLEHCGPRSDDHLGYRPSDEVEEWSRRDPIELLERVLGLASEERSAILGELTREVEEAFVRARGLPFPDPTILSGLLHA